MLDGIIEKIGDAALNASAYLTLQHLWNKYYLEDAKKNTEKLGELTEKELKKTEGETTEPCSHIAIPLLYLNSYTNDNTLRELFAKLLATSMQKDRTTEAHISFVRVLEQLSPEEALLMKTTNILQESNPVARIVYQDLSYDEEPVIEGHDLMFGFTSGDIKFNNYALLDSGVNLTEKQIAFFLENLKRLNLIDIDYSVYMGNTEVYTKFRKNDFYDSIMQQIVEKNNVKENFHLVYTPGVIKPTEYGKKFYEVCVK